MLDFLHEYLQWIFFIANMIASILLIISIIQKKKSIDNNYKGKFHNFTAYFSGFVILLGTFGFFIEYESNNWNWASYIIMAILGDILYLRERKI